MSAHTIFEHAPIGAIIAWSDGTPRPPERHSRKLSAWKNNNSQGRLISKEGGRHAGMLAGTASFTLHEADFGASGVIAIRVHRTFALGSSLCFAIIERPPVGAMRVFDRPGDHAELVHLAPHRGAAEQWLSEHGYPNAVLLSRLYVPVSESAMETLHRHSRWVSSDVRVKRSRSAARTTLDAAAARQACSWGAGKVLHPCHVANGRARGEPLAFKEKIRAEGAPLWRTYAAALFHRSWRAAPLRCCRWRHTRAFRRGG